MERIVGYKLTHEQEVFKAQSFFKLNVYTFPRTWNEEVCIELFAKFADQLNAFFKSFLGTPHANVFPHDMAELFVDTVHRTLALNGKEAVDTRLHIFFYGFELGKIGRQLGPDGLVCQVVLNGIGQYKVAVGQALHQCRGSQAVGSVVGEVTFADGEKSVDGGHQFVVHPNAAHCVVHGGEDLHRCFVGALVGDFFVHIEEVAVACFDFIATKVFDGLREIEEYGQTGIVHTEAFVATLFSGTAGHIARHKVAKSGITTLQVVVAIFFGNILALNFASLQFLGIFEFLGHPDTSVVAKRL